MTHFPTDEKMMIQSSPKSAYLLCIMLYRNRCIIDNENLKFSVSWIMCRVDVIYANGNMSDGQVSECSKAISQALMTQMPYYNCNQTLSIIYYDFYRGLFGLLKNVNLKFNHSFLLKHLKMSYFTQLLYISL